jgi:hydrogenase nickel incorporation protein HypB
MCETCGCADGAEVKVINLETGKAHNSPAKHEHKVSHGHAPDDHYSHDHKHDHHHDHAHGHSHGHNEAHHASGSTILLEQNMLAKNAALAARNRAWFEGREILALNLVSGPGAGKTTLLERTIKDLRHKHELFVLEGDQATTHDGERIKAVGAPVVQINTGSGCHLDSSMVARGLAELKPSFGSIVIIENVGNLVCPALFDLGECAKVVILSVTEGDDKPIKYPHMFQAASLLLINKIDLLPHVDFKLDSCLDYAQKINPGIEIMTLSATTGEGLEAWFDWISATSRTRSPFSQDLAAYR